MTYSNRWSALTVALVLAGCDRGTTTAPGEGFTPSLTMSAGACQTAPTLISQEFLPDGRVKFKWDQQNNMCRLHHWFELRVDATELRGRERRTLRHPEQWSL
jgi:hypothetical protein